MFLVLTEPSRKLIESYLQRSTEMTKPCHVLNNIECRVWHEGSIKVAGTCKKGNPGSPTVLKFFLSDDDTVPTYEAYVDTSHVLFKRVPKVPDRTPIPPTSHPPSSSPLPTSPPPSSSPPPASKPVTPSPPPQSSSPIPYKEEVTVFRRTPKPVDPNPESEFYPKPEREKRGKGADTVGVCRWCLKCHVDQEKRDITKWMRLPKIRKPRTGKDTRPRCSICDKRRSYLYNYKD